MLKKHATKIVGGLSSPGKMPCRSYGISARQCNIGSKLRKVKGSTCSTCYALKGQYVFANVAAAHARRLESLNDPQWVDAMVTLIDGMPYFRWHDSGDIQSLHHLCMIVDVCKRTPNTRHWLPTREKQVLAQYARTFGALPSNLVARVSAAMIDGAPPSAHAHTSTVHKTRDAIGQGCPAYTQEGFCGDCRACWDSDVANVSYPLH